MKSSSLSKAVWDAQLTTWTWIFIGLGAVLRFFNLFLFPHFHSEETDGYLQAARFLMTDSAPDRIAFGYRQLLMPVAMSSMFENLKFPVFSFVVIEAIVTALVPYCIFRICRWLKVSSVLTFLCVAFVAIYGRFLLYSITMAPEGFIVAAIAIVFVLVTLCLDDITERRSGFRPTLHIAALTAVLYFMVAIKELFLIFSLLSFSVIGAWLLLSSRREGFRYAPWVRIASAGVVFLSCWFSGLSYAREVLGTTRFRTTCFPWPIAVTCYYLDLESPLHAEFKTQVADVVRKNKKDLESWNFAYYGGNAKVNSNCQEGPAGHALVSYAERVSGIRGNYGYESMCAVEKVGSELFKEGVTSQLPHYLRYWVLPEVIRALFTVEKTTFAGSFREFSESTIRRYSDMVGEESRNETIYRLFYPPSGNIAWRDIPILRSTPFAPAIFWCLSLAAIGFSFWRREKRHGADAGQTLSQRLSYQIGAFAFVLGATLILLLLPNGTGFAYWKFVLGLAQPTYDDIRLGTISGLPYSYGPLSAILILSTPFIIALKSWRRWSIEKRLFLSFLATFLLVYIALVSTIVWFYERYTSYIFLPLTLLAVTFMSTLIEEISERRRRKSMNRQEISNESNATR